MAKQVVDTGADLGIALDGDGDRLGIVTNKGEFIDADKMLMLLVENILPNYVEAPVVFDVKCSSELAGKIISSGGKPVMHRSGHSFMKQKMQETGAPIGGEYAAHIFFKDRWFGFDDGIYTAARIVEILSSQDKRSSEVFGYFYSGPFSLSRFWGGGAPHQHAGNKGGGAHRADGRAERAVSYTHLTLPTSDQV